MKYISITKSGLSGQPISARLLNSDLKNHGLVNKNILITDKARNLVDRFYISYRLQRLVRRYPKTFFIIHLNVESFFLQLFSQKNVIFINHGIYNFSKFISIMRLINIMIILWSYFIKKNHVFLVSEFQARSLKIKNIIKNRINSEGLIRDRIRVDDTYSIKSVGFVGRNDYAKNLLVLADVIKKHPEIKFVHLGPNRVEDFMEFSNYVHLSSGERTFFFSKVDLLLMPSRFESFGLVAYEAAYCGIPVIHSGQDGLKQLDFGINLNGSSRKVWKNLRLDSVNFSNVTTTWKDDGLSNREISIKKVNSIVQSFYHNTDL